MKVSKFPYFFYLMQDVPEDKIKLNLEEHSIILNEHFFKIKSRSKYIYLLLRYLPICIFFIFIFNKYDFALDNEKIIQYATAIVFFLSIIIFKKTGTIITILLMIIIGIFTLLNFFDLQNMAMPFIFKYLIFFLTIYDLFKNFNTKLYEINYNSKVKTHLITKE